MVKVHLIQASTIFFLGPQHPQDASQMDRCRVLSNPEVGAHPQHMFATRGACADDAVQADQPEIFSVAAASVTSQESVHTHLHCMPSELMSAFRLIFIEGLPEGSPGTSKLLWHSTSGLRPHSPNRWGAVLTPLVLWYHQAWVMTLQSSRLRHQQDPAGMPNQI